MRGKVIVLHRGLEKNQTRLENELRVTTQN